MVICTARSDRWGINNPEYDVVAKDVRARCRAAGIACKQGREFWESLRPWATLMGGMHHKDGGWKSLAWCWDREFVRSCFLKTAGMEDRHRLKILLYKIKLADIPQTVPKVVISPNVRVVGSGSVPVQVSYREPAASSMGGSGISGSTVADPIDIQASQVPRITRSEPKPPPYIPSMPIKVGVAAPRVDISGSTAMDVEPTVADAPMVPVVSERGAPTAMPTTRSGSLSDTRRYSSCAFVGTCLGGNRGPRVT